MTEPAAATCPRPGAGASPADVTVGAPDRAAVDASGRQDVLDRLAARLAALAPSAGATRVVAVDGPSGAGKTTLAEALARRTGAAVVHLDDLYEGWDGLADVPALLLRWVLHPLVEGRAPGYHPYDWAIGARLPWRPVPAAPMLLIEGCGAGARALAPHLAHLLWVEVPAEVRERRLHARHDWSGYAAHRSRWARQEQAMARRERTAERADVHVANGPDGVPQVRCRRTSATAPRPVPPRP